MDMKELIIEINKMIGETGHLRDDATLDYIVEHSTNKAKDIATKHPFVDGNKRTAFILWKLYDDYTIHQNLELPRMLSKVTWLIDDNKDWLDILKDC